MTKRPKIAVKVSPAKKPKIEPLSFVEKFIKSSQLQYLKDKPVALPIVSRMDKKVRYTIQRKDIEGTWSWGQPRKWTRDTWETVIFPHLRPYQEKTWAETEAEVAKKSRRNKAYPTNAICPEAQSRLCDLELEDLDEVFRFRVGWKERLYGFRIAEVFFVLWWDEQHKVCEGGQ